MLLNRHKNNKKINWKDEKLHSLSTVNVFSIHRLDSGHRRVSGLTILSSTIES